MSDKAWFKRMDAIIDSCNEARANALKVEVLRVARYLIELEIKEREHKLGMTPAPTKES